MSKPSFQNFKKDTFLIGATYSLYNSFDLFNDAILLLNHERFCRAYTLFQLSTEEAGKVVLLLDAFAIRQMHENSSEELKRKNPLNEYYEKLTKKFFNHPEKTKYILSYEKLIWNRAQSTFNSNFKPIPIHIDSNELNKLNDMKNDSLYTSVASDNFVLPFNIVNKNQAINIYHKAFSKIKTAQSGCIRFLESRTIPEEIDINKLKELKLEPVLR